MRIGAAKKTRIMIEEGLRPHASGGIAAEDTAAHEIAALAARGGAFDWLADEPELYDDTAGEPV